MRAVVMSAALAFACTAAAAVPPGYRGKEISRLDTRRHVVALTLDGGGTSTKAWTIMATLSREHVRPTFFLSGRFVRQNPRLARAIGGTYDVANHTDTHPHMTQLSSSAVRAEILRAQDSIRRLTGQDARPLFRFPYGDSDARTIAIANDLGYISIRWTVDTLGWTGTQTVSGAVRRVEDALQPGAIILMHIGAASNGATLDTRALPAVIAAVRRHGYSFTTFASLRQPR